MRNARDEPLQKEIEALVQKHPRYGYRRIHALLQRERIPNDKEGINIKRVHRLWKESNAQVPLLSSSNPKRAVKYWHDALSILRESGFLAPRGEANRTIAQMLEGHPTYRWQESWLDENIELHPAQTLLLSLQERAAALPASTPLGKKRGRPRKKKPE